MPEFLEIRLRADKLATHFRLGLAQLAPLDVSLSVDVNGHASIVNRFDFQSATLTGVTETGSVRAWGPISLPPNPVYSGERWVNVDDTRRPVLDQEIIVEMVRLADLEANNGAPSPTQNFPITVRLDLNGLYSETQGPQVDLQVRSIDLAGLGSSLSVEDASAFAKALRTQITQLDIVSTKSLDGFVQSAAVNTVTKGHSIFSDGPGERNFISGIDTTDTWIGLRGEIGPVGPQTLAAWTPWLEGNFAPHVPATEANDWILEVPKSLLMRSFKSAVQAFATSASSDPNIAISAVPEPTWYPQTDRVKIDDLGLTAIDACPTVAFWDPHDMDFDVDISLEYDDSLPNNLQLTYRVNWSVSPADAFWCSLNMAAFGPVLTAFKTNWVASGTMPGDTPSDPLSLSVGEHFAMLFTSPLGYLIATLAILGDAPSSYVFGPSGFESISDDDSDAAYRLEVPVNITFATYEHANSPDTSSVRADLKHVHAQGSGLVLSGELIGINQLAHTASLEVGPNEPTIDWTWSDICDNAKMVAAGGVAFSNGAITSLGEAHHPLAVLDHEVLDDTLGAFASAVTLEQSLEEGTIKAVVSLDGISPAYAANPYDLRVLFRTSGGARILNFGTVSLPTPEQQQELQQQFLLFKAGCFEFAHVFWGKVFNPGWLIDPPRYRQYTERLWRMDLSGASPAEPVVVKGVDGSIIGEWAIDANGEATIFARTSDSDEGGISVDFGAQNGEGGGDARPMLRMTQARLAQTGSYSSEAPIVELVGLGGPQPSFVLISEGSAVHLGFDGRRRAQTEAVVHGDFRGAVSGLGGVVLLGDSSSVLLRDGSARVLCEDELSALSAEQGGLRAATILRAVAGEVPESAEQIAVGQGALPARSRELHAYLSSEHEVRFFVVDAVRRLNQIELDGGLDPT